MIDETSKLFSEFSNIFTVNDLNNIENEIKEKENTCIAIEEACNQIEIDEQHKTLIEKVCLD